MLAERGQDCAGQDEHGAETAIEPADVARLLAEHPDAEIARLADILRTRLLRNT